MEADTRKNMWKTPETLPLSSSTQDGEGASGAKIYSFCHVSICTTIDIEIIMYVELFDFFKPDVYYLDILFF